MDAVFTVIVLLALFGVALATMVVVGTVKAARAVAAKVERTEANARRTVENVALRAKSFTKPGAQGELATVRLSLRSSLDSTRQVLAGGLPYDGQLGESLQLLTRLDAHATELDGELRLLEREPDTARIAARLPELRERAARINHSADSLRWAAQDRMRRFADEELARLSEECTREAGALRHWDPATGGLDTPADGRPSHHAGASATPGPAGPSGPSGPSVSGPSASGPSAAQGGGPSSPSAGQGTGQGAGQPRGISDGRRGVAEDVLGLAEPLARLAERLRRPDPGGRASGR